MEINASNSNVRYTNIGFNEKTGHRFGVHAKQTHQLILGSDEKLSDHKSRTNLMFRKFITTL